MRFSGKLWPDHPTLHNFKIVFYQQHYFLRDFWIQFWNSVVIALAAGALTLLDRHRRCVLDLAAARCRRPLGDESGAVHLFHPAAFLAVPMYRTMGTYGLLNNHWSLILAMVTIASPYAIWVLKQASDKLPVELDEAATMDGATTLQLFRLVYVPLMMPSLVAIGTYAILLAWNEYLYAFLLLSQGHRDHAARGARQLPGGGRLAVGTADDHRLHLRAAAGRDLLRVQAVHGGRADGGCGEVVTVVVARSEATSNRTPPRAATWVAPSAPRNDEELQQRRRSRLASSTASRRARRSRSPRRSSAITMVQIALISGFTPSRTSE